MRLAGLKSRRGYAWVKARKQVGLPEFERLCPLCPRSGMKLYSVAGTPEHRRWREMMKQALDLLDEIIRKEGA
jgi:hypothetical protein